MNIEELAAELDRRIAQCEEIAGKLKHGAKPTPGQRAELATLQAIRELIDKPADSK
jgi:hypothetical protein